MSRDSQNNPPSAKDQYVYFGEEGEDIPRYDFTRPLPAGVQPKPRFIANLGLNFIPAKAFPPLPMLGIVGSLELMGANIPKFMPPNLTRCNPEKDSDHFFVERRLNGFNPGKFNRIFDQPWQYVIRYDCSQHSVEPSGILPALIEARFILQKQELHVHSIQFTLDGETFETHVPGDADWAWSKRLFRSAEFVFQEIQSHLGRTHMNVDQYAMAYYRNVANNPIRLLLEPHLDGLLNINALGASLIIGNTGFIPEGSALDPASVEAVLKEEITHLSYRNWTPAAQALVDPVFNNHFDRAALTYWAILEEYVGEFFSSQTAGILANWSEIEGMSQDLVSHSILKPGLGTLAINNIDDLKALCIYVIYHSSFLHSWVNNKQYEDGGDIDYATIGLWDEHHSNYDPVAVAQKQSKQVSLLWTLSSLRYNPVMEDGPAGLKERLWKHREKIQPGIPLESIMMSINI